MNLEKELTERLGYSRDKQIIEGLRVVIRELILAGKPSIHDKVSDERLKDWNEAEHMAFSVVNSEDPKCDDAAIRILAESE